MTDRLLDTEIVERPDLATAISKNIPNMHGCKAYTMGDCRILVTHELGNGWHLSISTPYRDPTWDEIATARYRLLGSVSHMKMILPPLGEYVNLHPFTFHLSETKP